MTLSVFDSELELHRVLWRVFLLKVKGDGVIFPIDVSVVSVHEVVAYEGVVWAFVEDEEFNVHFRGVVQEDWSGDKAEYSIDLVVCELEIWKVFVFVDLKAKGVSYVSLHEVEVSS